jgi:DinB superfamily
MTALGLARPDATEYAPSFHRYVAQVPEGDLLRILEEQGRETQRLLARLSEPQALHRYAPGKWSVKEVVGHLMDSERVFAYRALHFARADVAALPGFDEQAWVPAGNFDARPLPALAAELDHVRRGTLALFRSLDAATWARRGTANSHEISVRALAYVIAGHERHHVAILRERYWGGTGSPERRAGG